MSKGEERKTRVARAKPPNPIKQRLVALEAWARDGIQGVLGDIHTMFRNFETVSDAYDILDINIATVKSLLVDKGVITEEEYQQRRSAIFAILDKERARRQAELAAVLEAAKNRAEPGTTDDPTVVDPELVEMRKKAAETTDRDHIPSQATIF